MFWVQQVLKFVVRIGFVLLVGLVFWGWGDGGMRWRMRGRVRTIY